MEQKLKIVNIKLSFLVSRDFCIKQKSIVIPLTTSTKITIYKHSPRLLNVTGIRDFNQISSIETSIKEKFQCEIKEKKIDAIMLNYKSKTHQKINLNKLSHICSRLSTHKLDYNCELFNAPFLKSKTNRGTLLLFSSGSIQVMGAKTLADIEYNREIVKCIYEQYYTLQNDSQSKTKMCIRQPLNLYTVD